MFSVWENKWIYNHRTEGNGEFLSRNAVHRRPNYVPSSIPLAQPQDIGTSIASVPLNFQELVGIAASSETSVCPNGTLANQLSDIGEKSDKLLKATPPPQHVARKKMRSPSPGSSTSHLLFDRSAVPSENAFSQSGTKEEPIVIEDLMDEDNRETDQQDLHTDVDLVEDDGENTDPGEDLDLMQYAFRKDMQQITPESRTPTTGNRRPRDSHRRSPRGTRALRAFVHRSGFLDWKKPVDNMLDEVSNIWDNVQTQWMELCGKLSMKEGHSMRRFNDKICGLSNKFRLEGICLDDVQKLVRDWKLVYRLIYSRIECRTEQRLMKRFSKEMSKFRTASRVLKDCNPTVMAITEEDDENDIDWIPNVKHGIAQ
ncbi:hypothetical protein ACJQWK_04766 [Exserohilum turcicum]|uniref:Uncharacterized protein n=1 Tax=Exserohilum turcicum (strain 28A) TaxID=671987 RepID=R0JN89_EXST2|nr:uncharacterized protein SETTUDRAFT_22615 [Exserohilum turcica Et28A]EOA82638.1 hypothetical protein SETTUDRAFT_22615 [Exserohilum turcica Et28A]